jgi:hypothetical protein
VLGTIVATSGPEAAPQRWPASAVLLMQETGWAAAAAPGATSDAAAIAALTSNTDGAFTSRCTVSDRS